MNESLKNLSKKELQNEFRMYLQQNNYAKNSIGTFSSQALFLFDKLGAEKFWEILKSNDFDNTARKLIYNELTKTGTQKYTSCYLSNLRCFRKFCGIITDYNEKEKVALKGPYSNKFKNTNPTLIALDAIELIKKYHYSIDNDYTRYKSWEHCYNAFRMYRKDKSKTEFLCLHLGCYLASWGMLRNSVLMNYDYLVHKKFVEAISNDKYDALYSENYKNEELVFDVVKLIDDTYPTKISKTDTLVTKVLLGVFGCTPAFDRYFRDGVKHFGICSADFGRQSLRALYSFYDLHYKELENLRHTFLKEGTYYTPMKLLDMCFWQFGYDNDKSKNLKD